MSREGYPPHFRSMECPNCYEKHGPILPDLDDYDWREAFDYAPKGITREDVAQIIAMIPGHNDGPNWNGVFILRDQRVLALSAWCDYTGWD